MAKKATKNVNTPNGNRDTQEVDETTRPASVPYPIPTDEELPYLLLTGEKTTYGKPKNKE